MVRNSTFHRGEGKGLNIENSHNITLEGNVFYDLVNVGGRVKGSDLITINENIIAHVRK